LLSQYNGLYRAKKTDYVIAAKFTHPIQRLIKESTNWILLDTGVEICEQNLKLAPAEIWRLYRGRGDAENRIKELKYDFGIDSFNLNSFYATEAALTFVMIAYDLMALFRTFIVQ
jgi:IS4 transposase